LTASAGSFGGAQAEEGGAGIREKPAARPVVPTLSSDTASTGVKELTKLIGELATRSETFRTRWGAHDVRLHRGGIKTFNHPVVGYTELAYHSMALVAVPGLTLTAYTAEPATPSAARTPGSSTARPVWSSNRAAA
jgi:hypothetical protein